MQWNPFYFEVPLISKIISKIFFPLSKNEMEKEKRQTRLRHTLARFPDGFTFYVSPKKRFRSLFILQVAY